MTSTRHARPLQASAHRAGVGARRGLAWSGLAMALMAGARLPAQSTHWIGLRELSGELSLRAELLDEKRSTRYVSDLREREQALREELALRAVGDIYHEKLIDYDARATIGLEQRNFDSGSASRSVDTTRLEYNVQALVLKDHPYSGRLYGLRTQTTTRQTFFRTTEAVVSEEGGDANAKEWWIPSHLHYHHYNYEGRNQDTNQEARDVVFLEGSRAERDAQYRYELRYNDVDLSSLGRRFDDYGAQGSMMHTLDEDRRDHWFNSARYRAQNGAITGDYYNLESRLDLGLTEDLTSDTLAGYDSARSGGVATATSETLRGQTSLHHRLYDSVDTTGGVQGQQTDFGGGTLERYGPFGDVAYRKRTFFGHFNLGYHADYYHQEQTSSASSIAVLDESHAYTLGLPLYLDNLQVQPASIVVTDITGLVLYVQPTDYLATAVGSRTRIDFPIGSRILPGSVILVDYVYDPLPAYRLSSLGQNSRLGLRFWEWVGVDLGYFTQDQSLLEGQASDVIQDIRTKTARVEVFHFDQSVGVDYEDYVSDFASYERSSVFASSSIPIADALSLHTTGNTFTTRFKDGSGREHGSSVSANLSAQPLSNMLLDLRGEWHKLDLRADNGTGYLADGRALYRWRKLSFELLVRLSDERFDVAGSQRTLHTMLTVSRKF